MSAIHRIFQETSDAARTGAIEPSRRRFIAVIAGTATAIAAGALKASDAPALRWRGVAMGADASLTLLHEDRRIAARALKACVDEIARLEMILSLYEPGSDLSRLNRDGTLANPAIDFVRCLGAARAVSERSSGAFDITVQPLFEFYRTRPSGQPGDAREFARIRDLVNYRDIALSAQRVSFRRRGMAATLNGIAQGYVSDRVAGLLRRFGFTDAMVDLGEIAALGHGPQGRPWSVEIADPDGRPPLEILRLSDRAMATSAPAGYRFDSPGRHHLFDPRSGLSSNRYRSVTVAAPSATLADGLSTAMAAMPRHEIEAVLARTPALDVRLATADGKYLRLRSQV